MASPPDWAWLQVAPAQLRAMTARRDAAATLLVAAAWVALIGWLVRRDLHRR